ncbi:hypothetical protein ACFWYJ_05555 [Streptomyces albireticuli]|uniref:hypothetical protein n=1 Tax=Streptomyces albireticuli TaxID=1940 RepID=UPI00368CA87D
MARHRLPAGTSILISPGGMHRDPDTYEAPEVLGRSLAAETSLHRPPGRLPHLRHRPRKCIGDAFT